jgi:hypothetical protein
MIKIISMSNQLSKLLSAMLIIILLMSIFTPIFAQEGHAVRTQSEGKYKVTYQQLKEYEGLYEYINNTTLKIAASPIDTVLLCLINESRYPLTALGNDLFLKK